MYGKWLNKVINKVPNIQRWQDKTTILRKNCDAVHSWQVSVIAHALCKMEQEKFGNTVDEAVLLKKCIFHDCLEMETGDILSSVKRTTDEMEKALATVENKLYKERIEGLIPSTWREEYEGYLLNPKDNKQTIEGRILAVADNIGALNECIQEVRKGNTDFKPYLSEIANDILKIDLESGKHFLRYALIDFGLPLEEYGIDIVNFVNSTEV